MPNFELTQLAVTYGPEVDMWAIGVITYVMLGGFPPFDGENDTEVFASILGTVGVTKLLKCQGLSITTLHPSGTTLEVRE
jgi:serine/threonine protein kinase